MLSPLSNEKGMTLIELLGSLVILSIVLIGFFSVFTQSAKMQNTNEEQMVATNLARTALDDVREMGTEAFTLDTYEQFNMDGYPQVPSVTQSGNFHTHPNYSLTLQLSEESNSSLWLAKIIIFSDEKALTETYTYIEVDSE
ncbi:type IV pilus modification PilV family protein [Piscibacillus sp. B03]|uniref:type IV pilus modification PilV family protein n=1 Tax=Piscibacillus sp. B03 TaxID=3457430 RepID=UPI003FCD03FE